MKKYQAIIYDLDGTLVDTVEMNMKPLQKIIHEETGELWEYEEVVKRFTHYPGLKVMEMLGFNNPTEVYGRWVKYVNQYGAAQAYQGVSELLEQLNGKIIQAVVSSKKHDQYQIDIVTKGWVKYFEVVVLAEDTVLHKPNPEPLLLCLEKLGINKEAALYIGDSVVDYECCQKVGIDFGYATWGSVHGDEIENPTYRFDSPEKIAFCLNK